MRLGAFRAARPETLNRTLKRHSHIWFTAVLFVTAGTQKQPKGSSAGEWIKIRCMYYEREGNPATCHSTDKPRGRWAKWNTRGKDKYCLMSPRGDLKKPNSQKHSRGSYEGMWEQGRYRSRGETSSAEMSNFWTGWGFQFVIPDYTFASC